MAGDQTHKSQPGKAATEAAPSGAAGVPKRLSPDLGQALQQGQYATKSAMGTSDIKILLDKDEKFASKLKEAAESEFMIPENKNKLLGLVDEFTAWIAGERAKAVKL
jgi:hypothetical protein